MFPADLTFDSNVTHYLLSDERVLVFFVDPNSETGGVDVFHTSCAAAG